MQACIMIVRTVFCVLKVNKRDQIHPEWCSDSLWSLKEICFLKLKWSFNGIYDFFCLNFFHCPIFIISLYPQCHYRYDASRNELLKRTMNQCYKHLVCPARSVYIFQTERVLTLFLFILANKISTLVLTVF